jgi:hypothetical protein
MVRVTGLLALIMQVQFPSVAKQNQVYLDFLSLTKPMTQISKNEYYAVGKKKISTFFYIFFFVFFVWSCDPVLNFYWSIVVCLAIVYTGFGGSFFI